MNRRYAGMLSPTDPLYVLLTERVLGNLGGCHVDQATFDVYHLDSAGAVFLYTERRTSMSVVVKFYGNKPLSAGQHMHEDPYCRFVRQEFDGMQRLRSLGFDRPPLQVVRPLAMDESINYALVQEFAGGIDLQTCIETAIDQNDGEILHDRLALVAQFLAVLHTRSRTDESTDPGEALGYLDKLIKTLASHELLSLDQHRRAERLREKWCNSGLLGADRMVLLHGDATPPHFLFCPQRGHLTVIDLERVWPGDCASDLGCLAAELKHLFWLRTGDRWASEPFIRHLYRDYLRETGMDAAALTERGRFFQGLYQLRIARNGWIEEEHRRALLQDGLNCLVH